MRPAAGVRRTVRVLPVLLLTVVLAACSALPESGPVRRDKVAAGSDERESARFTAPGPGQGDAPIQIVNGFLTAMTANPAATSAARSFLTRRARAAWNPVRSTLVYQTATVTPGPGSAVQARLSDPRRLDSRGGWLGEADGAAGRLSLRMVKERGEWRIANPPDELLIPDYFLEREYQPYDLYFFDQSERVLVPDRVYVPRGEQTASQLVRALLDGPSAALAPVTRTEFPTQTQLDLSVPVASDGTAEVPLSQQVLRLSPGKLSRAAAQLAWTLRQVPGVTRIRLTVDDTPVSLPDGRRDFSVQEGDTYAPTVQRASSQLFALRKGRLVTVDPDRKDGAQPVTGAFGQAGYVVRSFGAALDGGRVAAVTGDGRTVLEAPVDATKGVAARPRRVASGTDLLPPAYDALGDLWLVDRTPQGARVLQVDARGARPVRVPGITGRSITAFVVSRAGGRMAAIVDGAGRGDRVVTADLVRSADGGLARAIAGRPITSLPADLGDLTDLVWRTPNDLAVLGRPGKNLSEVAVISLDGSPGSSRAVAPDSWPGPVSGLVGAPDRGLRLYLVTAGGRLRALDTSGRWVSSRVAAGLTAPSYVG